MAEILVVDDDASARDLVVTVLGYGGHTVREAADGREALKVAGEIKPRLIIADLLMPTMDGFEFVRRLREDGEFRDTPVIFYTATYLESEARSLANACGVTHLITKPAEPQQIVEVVNAALGTPQPALAVPPIEEFRREHVNVLTAKLAQRVDRAVPRLQAMIELGLQLASERDPNQLLRNFCVSARKIIGAKYATVGVVEKESRNVRFQFFSGLDPDTTNALFESPSSMPVPSEAFSYRQPRRLRTLPGDPRHVGLPEDHPPVYSFLSVPIVSPDHVYGWLYLANRIGSSEFSDEDEGLAQILAAQVGRIYENGSLFEEIRRSMSELEAEVIGHKHTEQALRVSEERYRLLVENSNDLISEVSSDGKFLYVSPNHLRLLGYPASELLNRSIFDHIHSEDVQLVRDQLREQESIGSYRYQHKDGTWRWLEFSSRHFTTPAGDEKIVLMSRDVSERRRLEAQLQQAQKMEALGTLAGGIAHDFGNILGAIMASARLAREERAEGGPIDEYLAQIEKASERAASVVRRVLAFSRQDSQQRRPLQLQSVAAEALQLLRATLPARIQVKTQYSPETPMVLADPTQVHQILMNLVGNAAYAMSSGPGLLEVSLDPVQVDAERARACPSLHPGTYARLTVRDTGHGMPPATLARMFDPFFTTKPPGEGTGLGLSVVHGIMKSYNGAILAQSEADKGTSLELYFPAEEPRPEQSEASSRTVARGKGARVLLVDDEEPLVYLITRILERLDYQVSGYSRPELALEAFREKPNEFDLVLTDASMAGLSGSELASEILRIRPDIPVVMASGYLRPEDEELARAIGIRELILKPTTTDQLAQILERLLRPS